MQQFRIVIAFLAGLALYGMSYGTSAANAQNRDPQGYVEDLISDLVSSDGQKVVITGLSIGLTGNVSAELATVADKDGEWLEIRNFNLDWQPLSLLDDVLIINTLTIAEINVKRRPGAPETESAEPPPAPRPVTIGQFTVASINLAEQVAGQAAVLTASGTASITADPAQVSVEFAASRLDDIPGELSTNIRYEPVNRQLAVDFQMIDGPNGLLGNLLNVPGKPEVSLSVQGEGPLDRWGAQLSLKTGSAEALDGEFRIAAIEQGHRVGVSLQGEVTQFIPAAAAPAFSGTSVVAGSLVIPEAGGVLTLETFFIETAAANLDIAGTIDPDGSATRLAIKIRSPETETRLTANEGTNDGISLSGLQADASISGAWTAIDWRVDARAARFRFASETVADFILAGEGQADQAGASVFKADVSGTMQTSRAASWAQSLSGRFTGSLAGDYGNGQPFVLRTAKLATPTADLDMAGAAQPFEQIFDVSIRSRLSRFRTGIAVVDGLLADSTEFSGRISRAGADGPVTLTQLAMTSAALAVSLDGTAGPEALDLAFGGDLKDLALLNQKAEGQASFRGTLTGSPSGPDLSLEADGTNVVLSGKPLANPALSFQGHLDPKAPTGQFTFAGLFGGAPVEAGFQLAHEPDGTRLLNGLSAQVGEARLNGNLRLSADNIPAGTLEFSAPDMTDLGAFLLIDMAGSMSGSIELTQTGTTASADLQLTGAAVTVDKLLIGNLDADLEIADIYNPGQLTGNAKARDLAYGDIRVEQFDLSAVRDGSDYRIELASTGEPVNGTAKLRLVENDGRFDVTVNEAALNAFGTPLRLVSPAQLSFAGNDIRIGSTQLAIADGSVTVEGRYGKVADLDLTLVNLPLSLADRFADDLGLAGQLSGTASVSGSADDLQITYRADLAGVSANASRNAGLPALDVKVNGTFKDNIVRLDGSGQGGGADLAASGSINLKNGTNLDLALNGSMPLTALADRLARSGVRADGLVAVDLTVKGTAQQPDINGVVRLTDATLGDARSRFVVRNVTGQLVISDGRIAADLSGSNPNGGSVSVNGALGINPADPVDLKIIVRKGRYVDGTLVVAIVDADLDVAGSLGDGLTIGGDLVLLQTTITLDSVPPAARKLQDVVHRHPPIPVARQWALLQDRRGQSGSSATRLDIRVRTAKPILVIGRGINADFGGRLVLTGTTDDVVANGRFTLQRGTLALLGRQLTFDSGTLEFRGDLNPTINISVTGTTADSSVTLLILGDVENPRVEIRSVPELPPEEALANLIFQRSASTLSPIQLARVADAILVLSGGTGSGLFEGLRRNLGIDRLDVTTDAEGNSAVAAGRYINEKTYLGVEQGLEEGSTKVTIDLEVTRSIKLRAGGGSTGETEAGIVFEKEY